MLRQCGLTFQGESEKINIFSPLQTSTEMFLSKTQHNLWITVAIK